MHMDFGFIRWPASAERVARQRNLRDAFVVAGSPALPAHVVLVDRVIDPGSNSFRVRLSLPNPDMRIPSGLRCKLDLKVDPTSLPPDTARSKGSATVPSAPASPPRSGLSLR